MWAHFCAVAGAIYLSKTNMDLRSHISTRGRWKLKRWQATVSMGQVFSLGNRSLDIHIFMRYCSGGRFLSRQKKKERNRFGWKRVGQERKNRKSEQRTDQMRPTLRENWGQLGHLRQGFFCKLSRIWALWHRSRQTRLARSPGKQGFLGSVVGPVRESGL